MFKNALLPAISLYYTARAAQHFFIYELLTRDKSLRSLNNFDKRLTNARAHRARECIYAGGLKEFNTRLKSVIHRERVYSIVVHCAQRAYRRARLNEKERKVGEHEGGKRTPVRVNSPFLAPQPRKKKKKTSERENLYNPRA